jgi:pimeloyl-ACP methyl ester carboxylesterase
MSIQKHCTEDGAVITYRVRHGRNPWVLLHGFGCDMSMWDRAAAHLPHEVGLLVPELRGHGGSTLGWQLPSTDRWAEDIAEVIEREHLDRPALAGLSMGGYTALALIEAHPDTFRGLALISTHAGADDEAARKRRAAGLASLRQEGWSAVAESLMPLLLNPEVHDFRRHRDQLMAMFERAGDAGLAAALYALANRSDRRPVLPRIRVPVVVVVGDRDRLTIGIGSPPRPWRRRWRTACAMAVW